MLSDERGVFLLISPQGSKWRRLKYRFEGRERLLSLGVYPDVCLKDIQLRREKVQKWLAAGIAPDANCNAV